MSVWTVQRALCRREGSTMGKFSLKRMLALSAAVAFASAGGLSKPDGQPASGPRSNLEYWLSRARPATTTTTTSPAGLNPFGRADRFKRRDALPGVIVLSNGEVLAGGLYTTRDKSWEVWVESEKRWRHVPPVVVLGISAVVIEEHLEKEWRWKEMGSDEKIYTGRKKPIRRFRWRFHLIDDSYVTGAVKGQPLWIESTPKTSRPFILHERSAGQYAQTLKDLVYVKRVVISRRAMRAVLDATPAGGGGG